MTCSFNYIRRQTESQIPLNSLFPVPIFVHSERDIMAVTEFMVSLKINRFSWKTTSEKTFHCQKTYVLLPRHFHPKVVLLKVTFSFRDPTITLFWCAHHGVSCWLPSCTWLYLDNCVFFRALFFLLSALLIQIREQSFIATESHQGTYTGKWDQS